MSEKHSQKSDKTSEGQPANQRWTDNEAKIAARDADAVETSKRSDTEVRASNAGLSQPE